MKISNTRNVIATIVAALAMASFSSSASAMQISGEIGFGGTFVATGGTGLGDATGVDIDLAFVLAAVGDFTPTIGATATFTPLVFDPPGVPVSPLWEIVLGPDTYSFDLEDVWVDVQNSTELALSGTGTLMITGFDPTPGTWVFTGNTQGQLFTFSAGNAASVPEPGILMLLGVGVLGLALARRRRA
jgi:hypothetical protein